MLRATEKWVTYLVLTIILILGVVLLTRQIGITTTLKHELAKAKQEGISAPDLSHIAYLHTSSSKMFLLGFISICFLVIGIIMMMRALEKANNMPEATEKVQRQIKSATPGMIIVVIAAFLLAFCAYRASHIETIYSSKMIAYNHKLKNKDHVVLVKKDSHNIKSTEAKTEEKPTSSEKPAQTVAHKPVKKTKSIVARQSHVSNKKNYSKDKNASNSKSYWQRTENSITQADIAWAKQFQRNVTIYGYVPTVGEEVRYNRIYDYMRRNFGTAMHTDLSWAYSFLQKTKQGYQPKPGEMRKYEDIVNRNVHSSYIPTGKGEEL